MAGYDWNNSFGQNYEAQQQSGGAYEGYERDMTRSNLDKELVYERDALERQQKMEQYMQELALLKQSREYASANMRERAALEAQLFALKQGYLPPEMAGALATGAGPKDIQVMVQKEFANPSRDANPMAGAIGGAVGAGAGALGLASKTVPKAATSALGGILEKGLASKGASEAMNLGAEGLYNVGKGVGGIADKSKNEALSKLLASLGKNTKSQGTKLFGASQLVGAGAKEKAMGKAVAGLGGKALGKVGGALLGGPVGLVGGIAVGELINAMQKNKKSKEEEERERYLQSMYY